MSLKNVRMWRTCEWCCDAEIRALVYNDRNVYIRHLRNVSSMETKGLFTNDVGIFWGLWHPLVLMSAYHQISACPLVLQFDDVICEQGLYTNAIIENTQSTIHVPQKESSWAQWDPLWSFLDGFPWIVGYFIIHHLFWWLLVPPRQLSSAF